MALMTTLRRARLATSAVAVTLLCVACSPAAKGSEQEQISDVVSAVEGADPRVVSASAETSISGLSSGWLVTVVLSGTEPVSAEELGVLLVAARTAGGADPGHVDLFAKDEEGSSLDLTAAADEVGVSYARIGAGIGVARSAVDETLGGGS